MLSKSATVASAMIVSQVGSPTAAAVPVGDGAGAGAVGLAAVEAVASGFGGAVDAQAVASDAVTARTRAAPQRVSGVVMERSPWRVGGGSGASSLKRQWECRRARNDS